MLEAEGLCNVPRCSRLHLWDALLAAGGPSVKELRISASRCPGCLGSGSKIRPQNSYTLITLSNDDISLVRNNMNIAGEEIPQIVLDIQEYHIYSILN